MEGLCRLSDPGSFPSKSSYHKVADPQNDQRILSPFLLATFFETLGTNGSNFKKPYVFLKKQAGL